MKNIIFLLIIGICTTTTTGFSQTPKEKIDVLETLLKNEKNIDSIIKFEIDLANIKMANGYVEEARTMLQNVIAVSKKNKKKVRVGDASFNLGLLYSNYKQNSDSALFYYQKAITIFKDANENKKLLMAYRNTAVTYKIMTDSKNTRKYAFLMDEAAQKSKDNAFISESKGIISWTFFIQNDWEESLKYAKESLKYAQLAKNDSKIAEALGNVAFVYDNLKDSINANIYYEKGYKLAKQNNNDYSAAIILGNWARVQRDRKKAIEFMLEFRKLYGNKSDDNYIASTGAIGEFYFELSRREKNLKLQKEYLISAEKYLLEAKKGTDTSRNAINSIEANTQLSRVYANKKEYEKAYNYLKESTKLSDSFYSQDSKNKLAKIESQKELDLRDKEIEVNNLKLETQEKQQYYLIGGIALFAIIGGMLYYQSRTRRKANITLLQLNNELDESNKIKTRFFGILNHDLRAPVTNLIHFLHLQKEMPETMSEETKDRFQKKTMDAAANLLVSMEDMLMWSKSQMQNFKPSFKKVSAAAIFADIETYFSSVENVKISFENPKNIVIETDANYLKTIMRNLTTNSIKALEKTKNASIVWSIQEIKGQIQLSITDNGPGGEAEKFNALYNDKQVGSIETGLGLHIIRDFAKAIHCEIVLLSKAEKGTKITLQF